LIGGWLKLKLFLGIFKNLLKELFGASLKELAGV
jgi:hypothetical protein